MQDAALFFRSRALACFHRRRCWPLLSDEWRHEVEDARRLIRATRANWDDRPREITLTHYALGPLVQMQKPLTRAEELSAVILAMLRQDCTRNTDRDKLDSWAISAYERAILTLADDGYLELDSAPYRIGATVTAKGNELEARMDVHERCERTMQARRSLGTIPGMTPEKLARLYNITIAELMGETPESGKPGEAGNEP